MGTSVCADISQYALKNQYIKFLYSKISLKKKLEDNKGFFVDFLNKFGSRRQIFGLTSIRYLNILQFTKTLADNMCVLSLKKWKNGCKSIFDEYDKKNILPKKSFTVFKCAMLGLYEHNKFFCNFFSFFFFFFFVTFMKNSFVTSSWFFKRHNAHVVNNRFWKFWNIQILDGKKNIFSMLVQ